MFQRALGNTLKPSILQLNSRFYGSGKSEFLNDKAAPITVARPSSGSATSSASSTSSGNKRNPSENDQKMAENKSKISAFFTNMTEKFNETRRAEEKKALDAKKITAEQAAKASSFFEAPQSKTMDLQSRILAQDALETAYYRHARQVAKTGSKFWTAASQLTPIQNSKRILEISSDASSKESLAVVYAATGKPFSLLQARLGKKCTLVGFFFNQFGEKHVKAYMDAFQEEFGEDGVGRAGMVEISVIEQAIKVPLLKLMRPYISWSLSPERKERYVCVYKGLQSYSQSIGMTNTVVGWVHLVDENGFIRWQAHGEPSPQEIKSMKSLGRMLLR